VLVTNWHWTLNVYHYYVEHVFVSFMTAAMLTQHYGCKRKMRIFIRVGMSDGNGIDQIAPAVGITQDMKYMHGCFRTVIWGALQRTIFKVNTNAIISDRTLGTWFTAFRSHLRWYFKLETAAKTDKLVLLNVMHKTRTPSWMRSVSWHHPDYLIKGINFAALPVKKQWRAVANANGFLGSDGAGFSQMVFYLLSQVFCLLRCSRGKMDYVTKLYAAEKRHLLSPQLTSHMLWGLHTFAGSGAGRT